jgi:hypothetical protein
MKSAFIEGLARQNRSALAAQIALWDDSDTWKSAYAQIRKKAGVSPSTPALPREFETRPIGELRVLLLARLLDAINNRFPVSLSVLRLHELGLEIESAAIRTMASSDENFVGSTTDDLARYMLQKAAHLVESEFRNADEEQQRIMAERIAVLAEGMSEQDRIALRASLGINDLSSETIRKVMLTSGFGTGFALLVSAGGFASYTVLTSAIAAVAGAVGVTLPFGFYIGATSALAALTSPFVLGPLGIAVVAAATAWGNKKIHRAMLPMIVTQNLLAAEEVDGDPVLQFVEDHSVFVADYKFSSGRDMVTRAKECPGLWRVS